MLRHRLPPKDALPPCAAEAAISCGPAANHFIEGIENHPPYGRHHTEDDLFLWPPIAGLFRETAARIIRPRGPLPGADSPAVPVAGGDARQI